MTGAAECGLMTDASQSGASSPPPRKPRPLGRPGLALGLWRPRLVAGLLLLTLLPGVPEAFADLGHLAATGHSACADEPSAEHEREHHDAPAHEHDCSGLAHHCRCCPSAAVTLTAPLATPAAVRRPPTATTRSAEAAGGPSDGHREPPPRPPAR